MTLIQAIGTSSVYQSKNKAIYVPFALTTSKRRVNRKALLDSGATECFINQRTVHELGIKPRTLHTPRVTVYFCVNGLDWSVLDFRSSTVCSGMVWDCLILDRSGICAFQPLTVLLAV